VIQLEDVRAVRKARGLTQADLARLTGLTQATISYVERGKKEISLRNFLKIDAVLGQREVLKFTDAATGKQFELEVLDSVEVISPSGEIHEHIRTANGWAIIYTGRKKGVN
jgi:transcriptional regulator with XRE-family HTH domain